MFTGEVCIPQNGNASCVLFTRKPNVTYDDFKDLHPAIAADITRNGSLDIAESQFDSCLRVNI